MPAPVSGPVSSHPNTKDSNNKTIIATLIETVQAKVDPAKLYDLLKKMHADLTKIYETLFSGPLPAVSGKNLDLSDVPDEHLPDNLAYTDRANVFTETPQTILAIRPVLKLNYGTISVPGTKFARLAMDSNGTMFLSRNLNYTGAAWVTDAAGNGTLLYVANDDSIAQYLWNGAFVTRWKMDTVGVFSIGTPGSAVGAALGELLLMNAKYIRASNAAATAALRMIGLDANDIVRLGEDAAATGKGHVGIPAKTAANLPAAAASQDGTIVIDTTNNRLCFYKGGARYYVLGTAF